MKNKKLVSLALAAALVLSIQTSVFASAVSNSDIISSSDVVTIQKTSDDSSVIAAYSEDDESEEFATSGKCGDNLTWSLDTKTGVLTINGDGDMWDSWEFTDEWNSSLIKSVKFNGNITSIGASVFLLCENLESVTIPNTVTSVGDSAFQWCANLKSVTIGDSVTSIGEGVFDECESLTSVTTTSKNKNYASKDGVLFNKGFSELIYYPQGKSGDYIIPNTVTSIANNAFYCCTNLKNITVPKTVTSIGDNAFGSCENLTQVTFLNPECVIGEYAIGFETVIIGYKDSTAEKYAKENEQAFIDIESPSVSGKCGDNLIWTLDAVTRTLTISGSGDMWDWAYYEDRDEDECISPWNQYNLLIENVEFDGNVTSIGGRAFGNCANLKNITIPNTVTFIGDEAFGWCTSLIDVVIPDSVISIGGAFSGCYNLKSITIPDSVTSIGTCIFYDCVSLTSIYLPDSITYIGNAAFERCEKLTSINIPSKVTYIGEYAFSGCVSLKDITLPNTITAINDNTFGSYPWGMGAEYGCSSLTNITIPDSVTSIGVLAFSGCTNLQKIIIPKTVTSIGEASFYECENLTDLYYTGTEEEWKKISTKYLEDMDENHDFRYYLSNVKIHYNYGATQAGDMNGDDKINGKDSTLLMQYLAGWDVEVDKSIADLNKDGKVNGKDSTLLMQFLAGWDVTIG